MCFMATVHGVWTVDHRVQHDWLTKHGTARVQGFNFLKILIEMLITAEITVICCLATSPHLQAA